MSFVRRILSGMPQSYLIRSYLIGLVFLSLMIGIVLNMETDRTPVTLILIIVLNTLLFPFAKLVWDELRDLAFGNNEIFMNAIALFVLKLFVNCILWGFAIFVALGVLCLLLRTR